MTAFPQMLTPLEELIEEVEALTGPSSITDWKVHLWLHPEHITTKPNQRYLYAENYTSGLDNAKLVVPTGWDWLVRSDKVRGGFANVGKDFVARVRITLEGSIYVSTGLRCQSYAATPELALVAASLKAIIRQRELDEKEPDYDPAA